MVALDGNNQQIEPVDEVQPNEALESSTVRSSPAPESVAAEPPRLSYPDQSTGRIMDFMV